MKIVVFVVMVLVAGLTGCHDKSASGDVRIAPEDLDPVTGRPFDPIEGTSGFVPRESGWSAVDLKRIRAAGAGKTVCSIDQLAGKKPVPEISLSIGDDLQITGWMSNPQNQAPPVFAVMLLGKVNAYAFRATTGAQRADVARSLDSAALVAAGFAWHAKMEGVAAGRYRLILFQDTNGSPATCDKKIVVHIKH